MNDNLQVDDGNFTRIHHRILEELAIRKLSGYETRILFALWRKTYGWGKKADWISHRQFMQITSLPKSEVSRTLKRLVARNLVVKTYNSKKQAIYGFNKHFTSWRELEKSTTVVKNYNKRLGKPTTRGCRKLHPTIDTNTIHTNTKDNNIYMSPKTKPQNPKGKQKKIEPRRDPRVTICREYWYEQFKAIRGDTYPQCYGKDSNVWKYFLKIYNSVAWAKGFTDFYLRWDDEWVVKCGHSLEVFIKTLPSILEKKIHLTHWVKRHEEKGMVSSSKIIQDIFQDKLKT